MKPQPTPATIRDAFGGAQDHATSLDRPPPVWRAAQSRRRSKRWLGLAVLSVGIGGGLGWAWVASSSSAPAPAVPPVEAQLRSAPPGAATAPYVPQAPPAVVPPAPAVPALAVTRQGGVIRIDFADVPLAAAVRALAEATRTTVRGGDVLLAMTTERTTLHWQGSSPVAAWDALLGKVANTAVTCGAAACELLIVGSNAVQRVGAASTNPPGPAPTGQPAIVPVRPTTAPIVVPQPEPQDTETN